MLKLQLVLLRLLQLLLIMIMLLQLLLIMIMLQLLQLMMTMLLSTMTVLLNSNPNPYLCQVARVQVCSSNHNQLFIATGGLELKTGLLLRIMPH
jgi:hypothetical protein